METNKKQNRRLGAIEEHVKTMNTEMGEIRDEMKVLNKDFGEVKIQVTKIATNMNWLMKIMSAILMAVILGFVGALLKLVLKI